ncbi:3-isopropylmalate dehydratase [Candidatus Methylacidithermus pantelleriae]|nr:3-isopropylmalate dehydratase [Candidatus Methylacidithermus pantelleriae]
MERIFQGPAYVVKDNIDTDQIIPAAHLMLVPTIPEEYEKLGSFALSGLPEREYPVRFVEPGKTKTQFPILIAGKNFGCGSSREHAPIALGAAGCKVVVAAGYARIFFRNCIATGALYPCESCQRLCDILRTGQWVEVNLDTGILRCGDHTYPLRPLGDLAPVIEAGGIFAYARKNGLIPERQQT